MYQFHTKTQAAHIEEVIRLHKKGHTASQMAKVVEVTSKTIREFIAIY